MSIWNLQQGNTRVSNTKFLPFECILIIAFFQQRTLEGHAFDIYSCKLFPSGTVVLSGGADMQIKIFDALTGNCGATLIGHTSSVNDTAFVDRGKNIISVSK